MESSKLLCLIYDLLEEEKNIAMQKKLTTLQGHLNSTAQPNINEQQRNDFTQKQQNLLNEITNFCNASVMSMLPESDIEFLKKAKIFDKFGIGLKKTLIDGIEKNVINIHQQLSFLKQLNTEREKCINSLNSLKSGLEYLNIDAHFQDEKYEIGINIPKDGKENKIPNLVKILKDWNFIIRTVSEIEGCKVEDAEIEITSNGSILLYFVQDPSVAIAISEIIKNVSLAIGGLGGFALSIKKLKEGKFNSKEIKSLEDQLEKKIQEEFDKVAIELAGKYKGKDKGRKEELNTASNKVVKKISKIIQGNTSVEFIAPLIIDKGNTKEEKQQIEQAKKERFGTLQSIAKTMEQVKEIGKEGKEILNLLIDRNDENEEE